MSQVLHRYVLRTATFAFLAALGVLTALIWLTQALRQVDLLTLKGQSLFVFLTVTGLAIPSLMMVIAPIALFIAVLYTLSRLNGDSELVVMSAAGVSPPGLMRPFAVLTVVTTLLVGALSLAVVPWGFRELRDLLTRVSADFITRVVREGTFAALDQNFIYSFREHGPDDSLRGLFIQDRRDPQRIITYLAEHGATRTIDGETYLALENGSLQRDDGRTGEVGIVVFRSYNIDLTQFAEKVGPVVLKPRERSTLDLLRLDETAPDVAPERGRFRAELLDRFTNPLYALALGAVALAALGTPRTTRQGQARAMVAASLVVLLLRVSGFFVSNLVVRVAALTPLAYGLPLLATVVATMWFVPPRWWRRGGTRPAPQAA